VVPCGYPAAMAGNDTLIRIGKGVPGGDRSKRKIKPPVYWVLAAAVLIAVSALVVVTLAFGPRADTPKASPNAAECTAVAKAYEDWRQHEAELKTLRQVEVDVAGVWLETLVDDADGFAHATTGYPDRASKELAAAAAQYRFDVGMVQVGYRLAGQIDKDKQNIAINSWTSAQNQYRLFRTATC